jgi:hypothetical protein
MIVKAMTVLIESRKSLHGNLAISNKNSSIAIIIIALFNLGER